MAKKALPVIVYSCVSFITGNMIGLVINNTCRYSGYPGCAKTYQDPQLRPPN